MHQRTEEPSQNVPETVFQTSPEAILEWRVRESLTIIVLYGGSEAPLAEP
jgi:hypothetical protein